MSKPIKFSNIKVENIVFNKLEDNPRVKSQKIGYIYYKSSEGDVDRQLTVQTPEIDSEVYGIPREGPYYPDAKSRSFYKFGFCHDRKMNPDINYEDIEIFFNTLVSIDEYCNTDDFRKKMFGDKQFNKYSYQPLVRFPEEEDEDNGNDKKYDKPLYRPPFTKIKLDLEYNSDPDIVSTKPTFSIFEKIDKSRNKVELNNFDDVLQYIKYRSKLRFIIRFSKMYAMKTSSGSEKKKYGITLKAIQIEVQRSKSSKQESMTLEDAFIDSDTDDAITTAPTITRKVENISLDIDENENENEDGNEQIIESVKQPVIQDEDEEIVEEPKEKQKRSLSKGSSRKSSK
jgi:hypothetical protein